MTYGYMKCKDVIKKLGVKLSGNPRDDKKKIRKLLVKYHPDKGGERKKYNTVFKCYKSVVKAEKKKSRRRSGTRCGKDEYSYSGRCFKKIDDKTFYTNDFCSQYRGSFGCSVIKKYNLLPKNYYVAKLLGTGSYGKVYLLCNRNTDKCDRAIKIGKPRKRNRKKDFEKELTMTKRFHKLGIGPKFYDGKWLNRENTFYMVTGRIDDTLENYLKTKKTKTELNQVFHSINKLIKKMKRQNLLHGDFHSGNIGLVQEGNKIKAVPIDFGFSYYKPTKRMVDEGIYNLELVQFYRVEKFIDNDYPNNKYVVRTIEKIIEDNLGKESTHYLKKYSLSQIEKLMDIYYNLYR